MFPLVLLFPLLATAGTFVWAAQTPRVRDYPHLGYGELATFSRILAAIALSVSFWATWFTVLAT